MNFYNLYLPSCTSSKVVQNCFSVFSPGTCWTAQIFGWGYPTHRNTFNMHIPLPLTALALEVTNTPSHRAGSGKRHYCPIENAGDCSWFFQLYLWPCSPELEMKCDITSTPVGPSLRQSRRRFEEVLSNGPMPRNQLPWIGQSWKQPGKELLRKTYQEQPWEPRGSSGVPARQLPGSWAPWAQPSAPSNPITHNRGGFPRSLKPHWAEPKTGNE